MAELDTAYWVERLQIMARSMCVELSSNEAGALAKRLEEFYSGGFREYTVHTPVGEIHVSSERDFERLCLLLRKVRR